MDKINNILVSVDLSGGSEAVAKVAAGFAGAFSAKLFFLHVVKEDPTIFGDRDVPGERDDVAKELREERKDLQELRDKVTPSGVESTAIQIQGKTVDNILSEVKKHDINLMVVGGHKEYLRHLIAGDVVKDILSGATCPVVVVPSDGS